MSFTKALITFAAILALSTSASAKTGTASGGPPSYSPSGAPFPIANGTSPSGPTGTIGTGVLPYPTTSLGPIGNSPTSLPGGGSGGSGSGCSVPGTVTSTYQVTVTVTAAAQAATTKPAGPPYSIPNGGAGPIGTATGTVGTGSVYPLPTGAYKKRVEMRGLKREKKEGKRAHFWG